MKTKLLIFIAISIFTISCHSGKKARTASAKKQKTALYNAQKIVQNQEINIQVNRIISERLRIPITSIARSDIQKTKTGYFLKFLNVKTGQKYIFNTDFDFSKTKITKG